MKDAGDPGEYTESVVLVWNVFRLNSMHCSPKGGVISYLIKLRVLQNQKKGRFS